jgi:hypothetical protein
MLLPPLGIVVRVVGSYALHGRKARVVDLGNDIGTDQVGDATQASAVLEVFVKVVDLLAEHLLQPIQNLVLSNKVVLLFQLSRSDASHKSHIG